MSNCALQWKDLEPLLIYTVPISYSCYSAVLSYCRSPNDRQHSSSTLNTFSVKRSFCSICSNFRLSTSFFLNFSFNIGTRNWLLYAWAGKMNVILPRHQSKHLQLPSWQGFWWWIQTILPSWWLNHPLQCSSKRKESKLKKIFFFLWLTCGLTRLVAYLSFG